MKAKSRKLSLQELKLVSFTTEINVRNQKTIEGGTYQDVTISAGAVSAASPASAVSLLTGSGSIYIKSAIATSGGTTTSIVVSATAGSAYVSFKVGQWIGSELFGCKAPFSSPQASIPFVGTIPAGTDVEGCPEPGEWVTE